MKRNPCCFGQCNLLRFPKMYLITRCGSVCIEIGSLRKTWKPNGLSNFRSVYRYFSTIEFPIPCLSYRYCEITLSLTIHSMRRNKEIGKSNAVSRPLFIPVIWNVYVGRFTNFTFCPPHWSPPAPARYLVWNSPRVRSRSSVYAIDAFVHRAMSIIVCPSVCLFTE